MKPFFMNSHANGNISIINICISNPVIYGWVLGRYSHDLA